MIRTLMLIILERNEKQVLSGTASMTCHCAVGPLYSWEVRQRQRGSLFQREIAAGAENLFLPSIINVSLLFSLLIPVLPHTFVSGKIHSSLPYHVCYYKNLLSCVNSFFFLYLTVSHIMSPN